MFRGRGAGMTAGMVVPAWMREQVTAEQYGAWTAEQCAGIEIMDGMVLVSPNPSKRHNRTTRLLANALDAAAGPDWNADTNVDVRLQDAPLNNRRPDVNVYLADSIDITPTRPEHVLLIVESSRGSVRELWRHMSLSFGTSGIRRHSMFASFGPPRKRYPPGQRARLLLTESDEPWIATA